MLLRMSRRTLVRPAQPGCPYTSSPIVKRGGDASPVSQQGTHAKHVDYIASSLIALCPLGAYSYLHRTDWLLGVTE